MRNLFRVSVFLLFLIINAQLLSAQTEALKILSNGNVGIGTSNPSAKLDVNGSLKAISASFSNINNVFLGDVGFGADWAVFSHKNSAGEKDYGLLQHRSGTRTRINIKSGNGNISFRVDNNSKMVIKSNGNVGVGKENPSAKLDVNGTIIANSITSSGDIKARSATFQNMVIKQNGYVGIGTNNPTKGKLEIVGYASYNFYMRGGHGSVGSKYSSLAAGTGVWGTSIYAHGKMAAHSFIVPSDLRIKNIKGISESQLDLKTLNTIQITDYLYKDVVTKGNKPYKKVIAQQIKKVYPQAISMSTNEIPDIYQSASLNKGWVTLATNLKVGEKIQLIFGSKKKVFEILEANKNGFKVATEKEGDVFVYGRQVNDFHSVDYDAISMLNVSATQELSKQIDLLKKENEILKADNENLQKSNSSNQEALVKIQNRLQALENKPETKVVKTML